MNRILLASDGGQSADGAARVAAQLAQRLGAGLAAVVIYEPMPVADYNYGVAYIPTEEEDNAVRGDLLEALRAQLGRCGANGATPEVRTGRAVLEIPATARGLEAQVVVTGLGAHDLVDRALGGETALRLAQVATTPVLAVPAGATAIPRCVLAATDLSPTSRQALHLVAQWLRSGDELHIVYVVDQEKHPTAEGSASSESAIATKLSALAGQLHVVPGVRVSTIQLSGKPAKTLLAYAQQIHADLIALGSHGYGALKRLLLGSVASKVIRLASTAVLVVPAGATGASAPEKAESRE